MRSASKSVLLLLTGWFLLAIAIGISGRFESASAPFVAVAVWTLTAFALLATWRVPSIHEWLRFSDLRWLISIHLVRFVGIYFLLLCHRGELSCIFARPAGIGDIATAIGAVILLTTGRDGSPSRPQSTTPQPAIARRLYQLFLVCWNVFGLCDIIFVAFAAFRVGSKDWSSMAPLRAFPLSLLPTFFVPLIIASHILIFVRILGRRGFQPRA
jgi:hypothetical protein